MIRINSLLTTLLLAAPGLAQVGPWPAWRGPQRNGFAPGATPPTEWSETKNVAWKSVLPGNGKSTPIIQGNHIYVVNAIEARPATPEELKSRKTTGGGRGTPPPDEFLAFLVFAIDAKDGEVVWESNVTERLQTGGIHSTNGYSSFSPVTDGEKLYLSLGSNGVHCLDLESGDVEWTYEIGPQRIRREFGEAGSPALAGDLLIVVADQEDESYIHALDKKTGELAWKKSRDENSTWTTPLVLADSGELQIVVNGTNAVRSYKATNGDVLWSCTGQTTNPIPSPVSDGETVVVTSGFRGAAMMAFPLDKTGNLQETEGGVIWSHSTGTPYVPSPVLADGKVYMLSGNKGMISCVDYATGKVLVDRMRLDLGNVYASILAAGDHLYVVGRDGATAVLKHGKELEVVAMNQLDEPVDASPIAVGDVLYLRSDSSLYAIKNEK